MPDILMWTLLPSLGLTLLVFGFAPPFLLRLILRMFPSDDVRRSELMAELRALPWKNRPMWIAEQLETGLSEGLPQRVRQARRRRRDRKVAVHTEHQLKHMIEEASIGDTVTVFELREVWDPERPGQKTEVRRPVTRTVLHVNDRQDGVWAHTRGRWPRRRS